MGLLDTVRGGLQKAAVQAAKLLSTDEDVPFDQMHDALTKAGLAEPTEEKPRALFHDPYSVMDWGGWREKPSAMTYETLRRMAMRNTVIAACIQLRVNQLAQFARPQQGRYDKGYKVVLRDRRDSKRAMSDAEVKMATEIERMLETTGLLLPDEKPMDRDSFRAFVKKSTRDIITYDQWCWEKIRDRGGRISRFIALPSETIRPAVSDIEYLDPAERRNRVSHVQVYEDTVIAEFSPDDIAWCVMNPRSDLRVNSFGFSPLEQLTTVITSWLYGFDYNTRFFTQGSAIKGLLNIKGAIPDRQLKAFRRMWFAQVTGVQNAWRTPILNSEDIQWINLHTTNREMEYGAWMDWLCKLTTAIMGIDPIEINFIFGNSGQSTSLSQARPRESEVTESKDKGLRPLMEHVADHLNQHLIWEINPDFEFVFAGIDAKAEEIERDAHTKEVTNFKTVNEVRAQRDEKPLPGDDGNVILNPVWLQWKQGQQQAQQGGEEGGEQQGGEEEFGMQGPLGEIPGYGEDEEEPSGEEEGGGEQGSEEQSASPESKPAQEDAQKSLLSTIHNVESFAVDELRKAQIRRTVKDQRQVIDIYLPGGNPWASAHK